MPPPELVVFWLSKQLYYTKSFYFGCFDQEQRATLVFKIVLDQVYDTLQRRLVKLQILIPRRLSFNG